jgi:hypothetical protein
LDGSERFIKCAFGFLKALLRIEKRIDSVRRPSLGFLDVDLPITIGA